MAVLPALTERLSDGVIELRAIAEWDIPEILIAHEDDPGLAAALGLARAPSGAELGREVEDAERERLTGGPLRLTILTAGREDCVGRLEVRTGERGAEVTVWLVPQLRGRGLGKRAVALAADWLADRAGIEQLQCRDDRPRGG
jgi:RimJ/RimL family protein N-acetyltransferase